MTCGMPLSALQRYARAIRRWEVAYSAAPDGVGIDICAAVGK